MDIVKITATIQLLMNRRLDCTKPLYILFIGAMALGEPAHGASLNLRSADQVRRVSTAVGYCLGQEHALASIEKQPALAAQVTLYRARFQNVYPDACANLEKGLESVARIAKTDWKPIRDEINRNIALQFVAPQSPADASALLANFQPRLKGDVEPLVLPFLLAASSPNLRDPSWEMRQGWKTEYSTDEHTKAKGVRLHIEVPKSWKADEGRRPNIVHKWTSQSGQGLSSIVVQINSAEPGLMTAWKELRDDKAIKPTCEMLIADVNESTLTASRRVIVEGQYALICSYITEMQRMDNSITMANESLIFPWGKGLVLILSSSAFTDPASQDEATQDAKAMLAAVGNSLVLPDRY